MKDPKESTRTFLKYTVPVLLAYWSVLNLGGGFIRATLQTLFSINAFYAVVLALLLDLALTLYVRIELRHRRSRIHLYKIAADALIIPAVLLSRKLADAHSGGSSWSVYEILHWLTVAAALAMFFASAVTMLRFMWKR